MDIRNMLFMAGRRTVQVTDRHVAQILGRTKTALSKSLLWSADQIDELVERQIIERVVFGLRTSSDALRQADAASARGMAKAVSTSAQAFRYAITGIDRADDYTRAKFTENAHLASIVGETFFGVKLSEIGASFRAEGRDVSPAELAQRFADSGCQRAVFCVPGLLCDETLWTNPDGPSSLDQVLENQGSFLLRMRFNPGVHISENGRSLLRLMTEFLSCSEAHTLRPDVITFSLGGLIFRSAMYHAAQSNEDIAGRLGRAILISSPDGGSYLEKLGFWVGNLETTTIPGLQLLGLVGNQRSDGIQDLSHGLIREEDWKNGSQLDRYAATKYFGELDEVDAFQIYSLLYPPNEPWRDWLGDGIVEKASLTLLSEIYRRKGPSEERVHTIPGTSHFQVVHSEPTCSVVGRLLKERPHSPAK